MQLPLKSRREAGRALAVLLDDFRGRDDVQVLALPRGGVPVAYEVALALDVDLDVLIVRKLGVPGHEELAMGARSEEHTSELQSRPHLVCRLLLEKKKTMT